MNETVRSVGMWNWKRSITKQIHQDLKHGRLVVPQPAFVAKGESNSTFPRLECQAEEKKRRKNVPAEKNEATAVGRSSALANNATGFFRRPKECGVADVADAFDKET